MEPDQLAIDLGAPFQAEAGAVLTPEVRMPSPVPPASTPPTALTPGPPPSLPTTTGGPGSLPAQGDTFDDNAEYEKARSKAQSAYDAKVLSHLGRGDKELKSPTQFSRDQHPDYAKLLEAQQLLGDLKANPKEYRMFEPMVRRLSDRIMRDTDNQSRQENQKYLTQQRDELRNIDWRFYSPEERTKQGALVEQFVTEADTKAAADAKSSDPQVRMPAEHMMAVSPLGTLVSRTAQGTNDYSRLRDAATALTMLNPSLSVDKARDLVIHFGSPVVSSLDGKPRQSVNGARGRGGAFFNVLGRDARDNYVIAGADGVPVRIDARTYDMLEKARLQGYDADKQFRAQREQAAQPGAMRRFMDKVLPQGF